MNTGVEVMRGNLQSWSWGDIQHVYVVLGKQLSEYKRIATFIKPELEINLVPMHPGHIIPVSSFEQALWIGAWHRSVHRINEQLKCLDREILRRNNLIGVVG